MMKGLMFCHCNTKCFCW